MDKPTQQREKPVMGAYLPLIDGYVTDLKGGGKKVWEIVTGLDSEAKTAENDLIFMFCLKDCAYKFKETLEENVRFYSELF